MALVTAAIRDSRSGVPLHAASGRDLVFTRADAEAFVDELGRRFGRVLVAERRLPRADEPPVFQLTHDLRALEGPHQAAAVLVVEPGWHPDVTRVGREWVFAQIPVVAIRLEWRSPSSSVLRSGRVGPLHIGYFQLAISYRPGARSVKEKVLRAIGKVCEPTRVDVYWPTLAPLSATRSSLWIGRDAANWARAEPGRMLGMRPIIGYTIAVLPADLVAWNATEPPPEP